jgi:hypothetical protein
MSIETSVDVGSARCHAAGTMTLRRTLAKKSLPALVSAP